MYLRHTLLITEVYVSAVEVTREHGSKMEHFATEPDCWRTLNDGTRLHPDAELCLSVELNGEEFDDHYFIEADRGTEGPAAVRRKLDLYSRHFQSGREQEATGVYPRVLFVTLDEARRSQLASQLARQREGVREIFAVTHLSGLPALLAWGPENDPS